MAASDLRPPAVAGRFYPGDGPGLEQAVAGLMPDGSPTRQLAVMAPHAGYVYSGAIAGAVFAATAVPRRVVVMAPNHTGRGRRGAVWARGSFALPNTVIPVDEELCRLFIEEAEGLLEID